MSESTSKAEFQPNNKKLLENINAFHKNQNGDTFMAVIEELQSDNSFLVVPSSADSSVKANSWSTLEKGDTISFSTVFDIDGLKVFGVFTSPEKLMAWASEMKPYKMIPAKAVLEIAQEQGFGRIVIDSDQDTMFILERNTSNVETEVIKEDTEVLVWAPKNPIDGDHKKQLINAFALVSSIEEVYHFGMTKNGEQILLLAFVVNTVSENSRTAIIGALTDGMNGFEVEFSLDIMFISKEDAWYKTAQNYDCFYRK